MNQVQQTTVHYDQGLLNYCAANAWDAIRKYYNEPSTGELFAQVRPSVIRDVKRVFDGWNGIELHRAWRQGKKAAGVFKGKPGGNPTMRSWYQLDASDREGFNLFVRTVKECRTEWEKAQRLSRTMTHDIVIDELGPNNLKGIDTLISKLLQSKTEQDEKDLEAARIAYCVDVTRTTYNAFLQAIGLGKLLLNYDHFVPQVLSRNIDHSTFMRVFGETYREGERTCRASVFFSVVQSAREAFDRFQTARPAAPVPKKEPLTLSPWIQWKGKMVRIADMSNDDLEQALSQTRSFDRSMTYGFLQNEKARRADRLADKLDAAIEHQKNSYSLDAVAARHGIASLDVK